MSAQNLTAIKPLFLVAYTFSCKRELMSGFFRACTPRLCITSQHVELRDAAQCQLNEGFQLCLPIVQSVVNAAWIPQVSRSCLYVVDEV